MSGDLRARDLAVCWHPATHFDDLDRVPPIVVERAQGCWLHDAEGRAILDAIASWWTSIHGHGHPVIAAAIAEQAARLDHVMFAGFTHRPAIELAEALLAAAPPGMARVFYADCGSAAVEIALKISFQRRLQTGEPERRGFATLRNSYHGETLGALAVCGHDAYRSTFAPLLMPTLELPAPALADHDVDDVDGDAGDGPEADAAIALLRAHASTLSAVVVEPLVQCAGKMTMTGVGFYRRLVRAAQDLGIDVIADEIAVGFGRTGRVFASGHAGVTPDFLCVSKGLSGGVLPLAAVLVREGVEAAFRGAPERSFLHSHTFTANPIATAAGLASLRLLQDGLLERLPARAAALASARRRVARALTGLVRHHRQIGMIAAFDLMPRPGRAAPDRLGLELRRAALDRGVLLRPLHDTLYWMPPLTIDDATLELLAERTIDAVLEVLG